MKFRDIPQMPRASYRVNHFINSIPETIEKYKKDHDFDLDPPFQRGYVWTLEQKIAYLEYLFRGGESGMNIYLNHSNWMNFRKGGRLVLVDGKQRLNAVTEFLEDKVPVFSGKVFSDFEDKIPLDFTLVFQICNLKTYKEVVQWYIAMNNGGTAHTEKDIQVAVKELDNKEYEV